MNYKDKLFATLYDVHQRVDELSNKLEKAQLLANVLSAKIAEADLTEDYAEYEAMRKEQL